MVVVAVVVLLVVVLFVVVCGRDEVEETSEARGSNHPPLAEPSSYVVLSGLLGAGVTGGEGRPQPRDCLSVPRSFSLTASH